jgi:hypothetical protein
LTRVVRRSVHDRSFLIQIHSFGFDSALKTLCVDRRSGPSGHCVRVHFTWHNPAQLLSFSARCPIRLVNRAVSDNQAAEMLNPRLAAQREADVASPTASEPSFAE